MKKKLIASVMALPILASMTTAGTISVSANSYQDGTLPNDWFIGYSWGPDEAVISDQVTKQFWMTDDDAYSGTSSLMIKAADLGGDSGITFRNNSVSGLAAGEYVASIYVKGTDAPQLISVIEYAEGGDVKHDFKWGTKTDAGNGWIRIECNVTVEKPMGQFYLQFYDGADCDYLIDNVSLCRQGDTVNCIENGDFEPARGNTFAENTLPADWTAGTYNASADQLNDAFRLTNATSYSGNNSVKIRQQSMSYVQLNFRNELSIPAAAGEYTMSVYVKSNGYPCMNLIADGANEKAALQYAYDANTGIVEESAGKGWKKYSKTFTAASDITSVYLEVYDVPSEYFVDKIELVKTGETRNLVINGDFEASVSENSFPVNALPTGWTKGTFNATEEQLNDSYRVTDVTSYSGNNSVKVRQQTLDGVQLHLRNAFAAPAAAGEYTMSVYVKGRRFPHMKLIADGANVDANLQYAYDANAGITETDAGEGWIKYSKTFTAEVEITEVYLEVYNADVDFYVDKIELIKTGEAANLVENGDFEDVVLPDYTAVTVSLDTSDYNFKTNVTNNKLDSLNAAMMVAVYSANGELYAVKQNTVTLNRGESSVLTIPFADIASALPADYSGMICKGFIWDVQTCKPLADVSGDLFGF